MTEALLPPRLMLGPLGFNEDSVPFLVLLGEHLIRSHANHLAKKYREQVNEASVGETDFRDLAEKAPSDVMAAHAGYGLAGIWIVGSVKDQMEPAGDQMVMADAAFNEVRRTAGRVRDALMAAVARFIDRDHPHLSGRGVEMLGSVPTAPVIAVHSSAAEPFVKANSLARRFRSELDAVPIEAALEWICDDLASLPAWGDELPAMPPSDRTSPPTPAEVAAESTS